MRLAFILMLVLSGGDDPQRLLVEIEMLKQFSREKPKLVEYALCIFINTVMGRRASTPLKGTDVQSTSTYKGNDITLNSYLVQLQKHQMMKY